MLEHGGRLLEAARRHGLPPEAWLDLSTGINPWGWPVPAAPPAAWARLPEEEDGLADRAARHYGTKAALPVAGSQAAIQALPWLRRAGRVGLAHPAYREHFRAWRRAGHEVTTCGGSGCVEAARGRLPDVVVVINPNNPTGERRSAASLLDLHALLSARGGWLVVDEAFMDVEPEESLAPHADREGLIVLRSLGKFFGLAGARVGFVLAAPAFLAQLQDWLGPWALAGPSRWAAAQALADRPWQEAARARLIAAGARLARLLRDGGLPPDGGTALFQWVKTPLAHDLHEALARRGVLTRLFLDPPSLRFGLPGREADWERLAAALRAAADSRLT